MPKKEKLDLKELKITSFVTDGLKGGQMDALTENTCFIECCTPASADRGYCTDVGNGYTASGC